MVVDDLDAMPNCDVGEGDDIDGKDDVGTLRESDSRVFAALALLLV